MPLSPTRRPATDRTVVAVSAADDAFAMPLAVTFRSALDQLGPQRRLDLYVLDGGLTDLSKQRLLDSWKDPRLSVAWVRPDMNQVSDLIVSDQVNSVTYLRILMAQLLPDSVTRAIYLDADMLIRQDLGALWDEEQGDHAVLAVQDIAAPCIDAEIALPQFHDCSSYLAAWRPIANYRELGLSPHGTYLNGGLMVVDLAAWRRGEFARRMLACLREHRAHVLWWDQYALNVVLAGRWRGIDHRWNQGASIYMYPEWSRSPFDQATFARIRETPWIVHFCSPSKPWHYFCRHPFTPDFRRCVLRTSWRDWRPERPADFMRQWWGYHYRPLRYEWKAKVRALKRAVGYKPRRAA